MCNSREKTVIYDTEVKLLKYIHNNKKRLILDIREEYMDTEIVW